VPQPSGSFVADRVKNFRMVNFVFYHEMGTDNFLHDRLSVLLHFIFACCPNLEKLNIEITFYVSDTDFEPFVRWIQQFNMQLMNGPLMDLETHDCELIFATRATFPEETLTAAIDNEHGVTTMGEHFNIEQLNGQVVISRQVTLKEKFVVRHTLFGSN